MMEGVYSRIRYLGEKGRLRKCKGSGREIRGEDERRGEEIRKIRYSRREKLQERGVTREVHSKDTIWMR